MRVRFEIDTTEAMPWQARARAAAQRAGVDPRYLRRLRWLHKAHAVRRHGQPLVRHLRFVLLAPEPDNCTCEIANLDALAGWVAEVAGCELALAQDAIAEPGSDARLRRRVRVATSGRWWWSKPEPPFGKRLGWYALARVLRPERIVEVGAHDGLGTMLLLRALELNLREGHRGRLVSFDVNPAAGWLVGDHCLWELRTESSQPGLPRLLPSTGPIDMFVYDGWHSYAAEIADHRTVLPYLRPGGVLISDDAQVARALADLAREHHLSYAEFHEQPVDHFHPGAVLAASRRR